MKQRKTQKRVALRVKDFDSNGLGSTTGKLKYHKPGSQNHKK